MREGLLRYRPGELNRVGTCGIATDEIEPVLCRRPVPAAPFVSPITFIPSPPLSPPSPCLFGEAKMYVPNACSLVRCPSVNVTLLVRRASCPPAVVVEPIREILQASGALKDYHILAGLRIAIFQGRHHALRMDGVEPLGTGVDHGENVWEIKLGGENQGFDIINVGGLIG